MGAFAWVTLATNDSYSLGALVLAHSLKQAGTAYQLAVLVTPGVTPAMRGKLASVFNVVQEVNILDSKDEANLRLLKRPELGITFTKLHCWRLTQFEKCVFLDADTLVIKNSDELFEREELSAAPDVGWPDCFNSGVFVYRPSLDTYEKLIQFALEKGSFDGGDQGLLNLYFSDWAHKDINKHLPFIYNLCSTACYSYLPAFKQFGADAKIIHFIGTQKPWLQYFNTETKRVQPSGDSSHLQEILQRWWDIFCSLIHPQLSPAMQGQSQHGMSPTYFPPEFDPPPNPTASADDYQNAWDPWDEYDQKLAQSNFITHYPTQPIDSLNTNASSVADHSQPQSRNCNSVQYTYIPPSPEVVHYTPPEYHSNQHYQQVPIHSTVHNPPPQYHQPDVSKPQEDKSHEHFQAPYHTDFPQDATIQHCHETHRYEEIHNSPQQFDSDYHLRPVSPPRPTSPPSPPLSPSPALPPQLPTLSTEFEATTTVSQLSKTIEDSNVDDNAGLAGAFSQLTLGVARTVEQDALENVLRKQAWEVGNIDYLGKDSFQNIWSKITETLSSASATGEPAPAPAIEPEAIPAPAESPSKTAPTEEALPPQPSPLVDTSTDKISSSESPSESSAVPKEISAALTEPLVAPVVEPIKKTSTSEALVCPISPKEVTAEVTTPDVPATSTKVAEVTPVSVETASVAIETPAVVTPAPVEETPKPADAAPAPAKVAVETPKPAAVAPASTEVAVEAPKPKEVVPAPAEVAVETPKLTKVAPAPTEVAVETPKPTEVPVPTPVEVVPTPAVPSETPSSPIEAVAPPAVAEAAPSCPLKPSHQTKIVEATPPTTPGTPPAGASALPIEKVKGTLTAETEVPETPPPSDDSSVPTPPPRKTEKVKKTAASKPKK